MALNLFIIGPSGCGKSTQSELIAKKYNLKHFSVGQALRNEITKKTDIGLKIKEYVDNGTWVPNEIVIDILKSILKSVDYKNFIIDGFPRILEQGIILNEYLKHEHSYITDVILLDVSFEEIKKRRERLGQKFQDNNRTDNTPEGISARQKNYDNTINPIIDYFKKHNQLIVVDGNRPVESIFEDICKLIDKINY